MASVTIYPPIIDSYMPAFKASTGSCKVYFALSRFSTVDISDIHSTHVTIVKQTNGQSVVNKVDDEGSGRYRSTGIIIINAAPTYDSTTGLYYIELINNDVRSGDAVGWTASWLYKVQIRLSSVAYPGNIGQSTWLNQNANNFSEWTTYCTLKAIGDPTVTIPALTNSTYTSSSLVLVGDLAIPTDTKEVLYSYDFTLKQGNTILEESGVLYSDQYYAPNQFNYQFKTILTNGTSYTIDFHYTTINKYEETLSYPITVSLSSHDDTTVAVYTIDSLDDSLTSAFVADFQSKTTKDIEEDDGRVALKLYLNSNTNITKIYFIRRASSKDNFSTWEDIKCINCVNQKINDLPIVYDATIESGVWYKYGVEEFIDTDNRKNININNTYILREFMYSFLIGDGGRQLKLKYNNTMSSYAYTFLEGKNDTLGGQYPFIPRNGNTKYRTFPVNGLISFNMDENNLFTDDNDLYTYNNIVTAYQNRRITEGLNLYDFRREYDFREKVLDFLQDGKPKLFKSATEGNIIIRLLNIAVQPNQSLNRMIGSFSGTAYEIADNTLDNYKKYKFCSVGIDAIERGSWTRPEHYHSIPTEHNSLGG